MLSSLTGLNFTLVSASLPATTFAVVSFELQEAFSTPYALEVCLVSADPAVDFAAVMDNTATLTVTLAGVVQRSISGIVSSFEQGDTGLHQTQYQMVIRPELWRASLRQNSRIFQLQDIQTILATLMKENRITKVDYAFRYPHPQREFCVQFSENDLSFIQRLIAEEGIFYFFEFDEKGHTLVFTDDIFALQIGLELPYNATNAVASPELCISSLRLSSRIRPTSVTLKDYTFKDPIWRAEYDRMGRDLQNQQQVYEHYDYPGRFKDGIGEKFARYRLDGLRNDAHQGYGESNCFALQPGIRFTLGAHPREDLNTCWQPVQVIHRGSQPQALLTSSGGQGTTLSCQFSFIPDQQTWRPSPLPKPVMDGPQIAKVVGPAGEEIYTDAHGRVRLQFPWDREAKGDDTSSCWVRVSQAWAGEGWGAIAIPRIGQEVIVDFLGGDPDQPIVTGRTYHANNVVPNGLPAKKTQMSIRSKSYKSQGFNELRFEDATGAEELYLHAQKDMRTEVLHNRSTRVDNDHSEHVLGHQSVTVDKNQTIAVHMNEKETVDMNQSLLVGMNQTETVGMNKAETIGIAKALTVGMAWQTTVGMAMNTSVGVSQSSQVGLTKSLLVGQSYHIDVGKKMSVSVGERIEQSAGKVAIYSAGEHLELVCGKARLVLTKDGGIFLNGQHIELQSKSGLHGDGDMVQWNCGASQKAPDSPKSEPLPEEGGD
ncbi:type VI secretion system Vgr family protein [Serratia silvae]|uniref:Type VI secretion system tip protein VgrG n=1 Tax=Serratia silvae TaxID=2824122 RepID=A0ABT0KDC7_9GAMM|nr:type VI secretion system tip protein VgrG [Serratia silvae]MCL1030035.1 type VI secretion system tip protein VgrG [Serratia silvae]